MRTFRTAHRFAIPAVVGAIALAGAACETDDDPDVVEETDVDVTEGDDPVVTETETATETEPAEPTETGS